MFDRNASTSLRRTSAAPTCTPAVREDSSTPRLATGRRVRHAWLAGIAAALAAATAACGGNARTDSYQRATSAQEACCEHLQGPARDQCLGQIVRVDDPAVASNEANQATYRCIEQHFVCDPSTGHASQDSAQAQYDCIADLEAQ